VASLERIGRGAVSVALIVVAAALGVAGGVALYVRQEVIAPNAFADRATDALDRDAVREVVSREIVTQLIDRGTTDLISARPVIEEVVDFVVANRQFQRLFRSAAIQGNRVLFVRDSGNVAFDLADAGTIVVSALRSVSPKTAKQIPPNFDAHLLKLRDRSFATTTLRFADQIRFLGLILPALSLLAFALAVVVAPDRRAAITRSGIAVGAGCALVIVALLILKAYIVANIYGEDELTDDDVRGAFRGIYDAYLGDLSTAALLLGTFALLVAAASASLLRPFSADRGLARVRDALRPPERGGWRAAHGLGVMVVGAFVLLRPTLAVQIFAVVVGAISLYFGTGEVLSAIQPRGARAEGAARRRAWPAVAAGVAVVAAVGIGLAVALGGGSKDTAHAGPVRACNGYAALCDRRLDQVVFAGSHNSMSAADTRGWLLANQRRAIPRQLRDGVRLFLIDPHYGVRDSSGKVRTDFEAERVGLNRVSKNLTPQAQAAIGRLGGQLGIGNLKGGKREVWLCHSVCELGATRMLDALRDVRRFLERNPGEVVILFDEDYVTERDLDKTYRQAGLLPYLAELDRTDPLPTLRELVRSNQRVIVFTERKPSGQYPWNHDGFSYIQDTPLGATKPKGLLCDRARGEPDSPLLALNNWIDRFPPPLSANRAVLKRSFIERRARRCARVRGQKANLIASDFYDQGHLVEAVRELNGVSGPPSPTR
jgi:hypothetical protein